MYHWSWICWGCHTTARCVLLIIASKTKFRGDEIGSLKYVNDLFWQSNPLAVIGTHLVHVYPTSMNIFPGLNLAGINGWPQYSRRIGMTHLIVVYLLDRTSLKGTWDILKSLIQIMPIPNALTINTLGCCFIKTILNSQPNWNFTCEMKCNRNLKYVWVYF